MVHITFDLKNNVQVDCSIYMMESLFGTLNFEVWYDSDNEDCEDCEE